jgi:hypothetical protein
MNAFAPFPALLHWDAQQLADAVPPRLHQLYAASATAAARIPAANAARLARRAPSRPYLRGAALPRFRIL